MEQLAFDIGRQAEAAPPDDDAMESPGADVAAPADVGQHSAIDDADQVQEFSHPDAPPVVTESVVAACVTDYRESICNGRHQATTCAVCGRVYDAYGELDARGKPKVTVMRMQLQEFADLFCATLKLENARRWGYSMEDEVLEAKWKLWPLYR